MLFTFPFIFYKFNNSLYYLKRQRLRFLVSLLASISFIKIQVTLKTLRLYFQRSYIFYILIYLSFVVIFSFSFIISLIVYQLLQKILIALLSLSYKSLKKQRKAIDSFIIYFILSSSAFIIKVIIVFQRKAFYITKLLNKVIVYPQNNYFISRLFIKEVFKAIKSYASL